MQTKQFHKQKEDVLRRSSGSRRQQGASFTAAPLFRDQSNEGALSRSSGLNRKKLDTSGLLRANTSDMDLGGRTPGEFIGDIARPVGTFFGNVLGGTAAALTGINITSNTTAGPTWNNHGSFNWRVGFNTTGRNGWLVQKINASRRGEDNTGANLPIAPATPEYWEAWAVDGAGNVTPNIGATNDIWSRRVIGNNTTGHWSMTGKVYFTQTDPATQGFVAGAVPEAGILPATTNQPAGLGLARLHRYAQGHWDSTIAVPTHSGSAS